MGGFLLLVQGGFEASPRIRVHAGCVAGWQALTNDMVREEGKSDSRNIESLAFGEGFFVMV
ncbi:MAG: hypothetical protein A2848_01325 [Candidatus Magasanikbacteria bacterium RIFCSPHIGHO2_01_FULL_50_8]|uniref:Uncharacterized protein n=1 Tax=Candidatus Magasanikbacteria bacterium RIFCSPHIGHO2_01_FULL_50_8 TaxID=1798674 RepID=A0A1F6LRT0_9BACT|nr:MAG: hypothetical protein A2848_01325 [Candidatus Magasanikbacteria bacterium RIFCSPHIGHO2_01_FULL_50_8]